MAQDFTTPAGPGPVQEYPLPGAVPPPPPPKKNNTVMIIIIVVAVILLCCCCLAVAGYWAYNNGDSWINNMGIPSSLVPALFFLV